MTMLSQPTLDTSTDGMILVAGGTFRMGSDRHYPEERPVHRVTVGNHLGQNYGRVVAVTDSEIRLVEVIPDGIGGYLERPAKIALASK